MSEENKNEKIEVNIDEVSEETNLELSVDGDAASNMVEDNSLVEVDENLEDDIDLNDLRKLVEFTRGIKNTTDEELEELKNNPEELARLFNISMIKASKFNYRPKKKFGVAYKKKRRLKNAMRRKSVKANRKNNKEIKYS
jgi:hypothetical protein